MILRHNYKVSKTIVPTFQLPYHSPMESLISFVHIVITIFMTLGILLQSRASGLSATFGGTGSTSVVQRRGAEKLIYKGTIYLAVAFFALSILRWYL